MSRQLRHRGGLTCALQTRHHDDRRRLCRQIEPLTFSTQHRLQFSLNNLQKGLAWGQALRDFCANSPILYAVGEFLDYGQRYIGLKQRHTHVAKRIAYIVFGDFCFS